MSAVRITRNSPEKALGIVARFSIDLAHPKMGDHIEIEYIPKKYAGFHAPPNAPKMMVRRAFLKGAMKDWCETNRAFVTVTVPRRKRGESINITIRNKPELAVDFRMRFT